MGAERRCVKGGGDREPAAQPSQGCWFPADRQSSILNAYRRCCRWRSRRQRSFYQAVGKAPLIFHQNHVYARKQTKKEVCRLNLPCSLSVTHTHVCSRLLIFSRRSRSNLNTPLPSDQSWSLFSTLFVRESEFVFTWTLWTVLSPPMANLNPKVSLLSPQEQDDFVLVFLRQNKSVGGRVKVVFPQRAFSPCS